MTGALVRTGVVTVCCGGHRPAADCVCCYECVTGVATAGLDLAIRAVLARDERERHAALRMALRRAFHLVCAAEIDDQLRDLVTTIRSTVGITRVFEPDELAAIRAVLVSLDLPHFEGSLT